MSKFCVGSMDTAHGWEVESPTEALSLHFTYWFTSRRSQGKVAGDVPSFYYLWSKYGTDKEDFVERVRESFEDYLKELFPESSVDVSTNDKDGSESLYRMVITAVVISDGNRYDLARTILVTGENYKVLDDARLGKQYE